MTEDRSGYLLVHFVEEPEGYGEQIYFSLSDRLDPLVWTRANAGRPVLASTLGTTGVRDPYLVRGEGENFIIATDLRVYGGDQRGWAEWTRHGSRSLVVWRSTDLVDWSEPWLVEVAPENAGMAWAPEALYDEETGEYLVFWSSSLYGPEDPDRVHEQHSRILVARTRDFRSFSPAETLVDLGPGHGVIDMTAVDHAGKLHRFLKGDDTKKLFQQVGSDFFADDFVTVTERIADELYSSVEAPLIFHDDLADRWYLWVDQFSALPQGYLALWTTELETGDWTAVPADQFRLPASSKHGVVVPLRDGEWDALAARYLTSD